MQYKMYFRFSDGEGATRFWERTFWGFAFSGLVHVSRFIRKTGSSTITMQSDSRDHYRFLVVMAMDHASFTGTEITHDGSNGDRGNG